MTVYLSGPITGTPDYRARFAAAEARIKALGDIDVFNPGSEPERPEWSWGDWMIYDLHMLRHSDVMVTLPGSECSAGCAVERKFARGHGIPIVAIDDDECLTAILGW